MKKLTFSVTLTFESKISDDNEILEVANNIALAIKDGANGHGIAPEISETFLETIEVKPQFTDGTVTLSMMD